MVAIIKCRCGGKTVFQRITVKNWWGDKVVALVENVPAWVCESCGEVWFEAEVSRQLDHIAEGNSPVRWQEGVPVYAFTRAVTKGRQ